jgi:hypothetical protein
MPMSGTWAGDQTLVGQGYVTSGPTYTLVNPVSVTIADKSGRVTDQITTTGSGALYPTNTFSFTQSDYQTWKTTQYNDSGQTVSTRVYFNIPSSGVGTSGTNYAETDYAYDALERQKRLATPGGTITRTVWTTPQQVASVWMGTNDTGATDSNPAGSGSPNNMVMISQNFYDGVLVNLSAPSAPTLSDVSGGSLAAATYYVVVTYTNATGQTLPSGESSHSVAASHLLKVTSPASLSGATGYNVYVSTTSGAETLQNSSPISIGTAWTQPTSGLVSGALPAQNGDGNLTAISQYAGSSDQRITLYGYDFRDRRTSMTDATSRYTVYTYDNMDRQTEVQSYSTSGGTLYAQGKTNYDDRGRVYQTLTYAVDPSTGTVGNALTSNSWYDPSGNLLQQIAQGAGTVFTKSSYNGLNWVTASYTGYNTSGTSYSQATTVSGDIILSQNVPTYDAVGNTVSSISYDRLNDASTSTTGALTSSIARLSYTASWFDGINRTIASANYGAMTGTFTRPSTPPSSSSTVLVNKTSYDTSSGRVSQTIDPLGYITQMGYDDAGRTTQVLEAYGTGNQRETDTTYTLDNLISTLTAVNSTTGNQITTYTYGSTLSTSGVARNDLLAYVDYPDSVSGSDRVSYTYNRLGQQLTITDQRGSVRTLYYDKLGRQTNDCVTTAGSGVDTTVLQIATAYEVRGMVQTVTSYNNATPGSGTVVNQVQLTYNTFSQLAIEYQSHSGAVNTSTSPKVQYGYDSGGSSSNEIRPTTLTYPNGRVVTSSYGTSGGMNDRLNRIDTVADTTSGTTNLASYTYLGTGKVVRISYPQANVWLDLWGGTSGTFNGLDLFNRIIDQRWQNSTNTTPVDVDRYKYGYDLDSNRQWKQNVVSSAASVPLDEYYDYDSLNRLTEMQRGTLTGGPPFTGIGGTPVREMDYTLDPTGNWTNYVTKTSGTTDLSQTRTQNKVNEITAIGGTPGWATPPAYDAAGNMTTFPQPNTPTSSYTATYDAWNRMMTVSATGSPTYAYDGRGRRITSTVSSTTRHFYFSSSWQDIEERLGSSTSMDNQNVWGLRHIDELICRDDASPARYYATQDANFNLTSICNTSGTLEERYYYDPYGNRIIMTSSWTVISSSAYAWVIGFQGLMHDGAIESVYVRTRWLQTELGRPLNRCPWGYNLWNRLNLYDYCVANPIGYTEPFSDPVDVGVGVVLGLAFLFGASGCSRTPPPAPPPTCGSFLVQNLGPITRQDGTVGPGWGVRFLDNNCCKGGTIHVIQAIDYGTAGFFQSQGEPHFDELNDPKDTRTSQTATGYTEAGGMNWVGSGANPLPYGYADAPEGSPDITSCAVCDVPGKPRKILSCVSFSSKKGVVTGLGPANAAGQWVNQGGQLSGKAWDAAIKKKGG